MFIADRSISSMTELPVAEALKSFRDLNLPGRRGEIAAKILKEVISRLGFLVDVGLEYLTMARAAESLSGGEAQRIRLASQIGAGLTGVLYVLDEPSIGLTHATTPACSGPSSTCAISATPWWWLNTTRRRSVPPTTCSTSARAPACTAAR